jgi:hypothetical protein
MWSGKLIKIYYWYQKPTYLLYQFVSEKTLLQSNKAKTGGRLTPI